jgi:hypothetical protein
MTALTCTTSWDTIQLWGVMEPRPIWFSPVLNKRLGNVGLSHFHGEKKCSEAKMSSFTVAMVGFIYTLQ